MTSTDHRRLLARAYDNLQPGDLTENAQIVLEKRYLAKDKTGTIYEDPDEMFRRVAHNIAEAELTYGASPDEREATEQKFYEAMSRLEFIPNSPTLMNAGRELQQLSACFVLPVEDSLDAIFSSVRNTALIHKSGGGTGFSFSNLRPAGDVVGSTGGVASGPVSFIQAFDKATDVVKQGGTRRGANMGILSVTHPDILDFISAKLNGEQLTNFNISVGITDDFMAALDRDDEYNLVNPRSGEIVGCYRAKDVFDKIVSAAWTIGDPGLVFLDRIADANPNPSLGRIESTNPCGEQPLLPYESCNLGSINLRQMVKKDPLGQLTIDWDKLRKTVHLAVRFLDNVVDMNQHPLPEIAEMSDATRRIGLGLMGWADLLVQVGIRYDSAEALELADHVSKTMWHAAHLASNQLAEERGCYGAWESSTYAPRLMRNTAPVTIAPTGTISTIAGASSGIEPLFALAYNRNVMDGVELTEYYELLTAVLGVSNLSESEQNAVLNHVREHGSLSASEAPKWLKETFRVSHEIEPYWHVKMQAAFQHNVDNGVSKTINLPASATVKDVEDAYLLAYETGCKGITIYRDGSRTEQVLTAGHSMHSQNGSKPAPEPTYAVRPRPRRLAGETQMVRTGHGNMYVTVNHDSDGNPFEVLGTIGKAGGCDAALLEGVTRLITLLLRSGVPAVEIYRQLQGIVCCPVWEDGKLIKSAPDALAHVLQGYLEEKPVPAYTEPSQADKDVRDGIVPDLTYTEPGLKMSCPDCGSMVAHQEGCTLCGVCGWSRC